MELKVRIRYLGKSALIGRPKREHILIEGQKFWNVRKFDEQNDDLSYTRDLGFYERNKPLLENRKLFIVEMVDIKTGETEQINAPADIPNRAALSPELAEKGVTEEENEFHCPHCNFTTPAIGDGNEIMSVHLMDH